MELHEKIYAFEARYSQGRHCRDISKLIPSGLTEAVDEWYVNSDGYWLYVKEGWTAYDGGSDVCHTIHEYTVEDLKSAIKTIRRE